MNSAMRRILLDTDLAMGTPGSDIDRSASSAARGSKKKLRCKSKVAPTG